MFKRAVLLPLVLLLFVLVGPGLADTPGQLAQAQQLEEQGKFPEAEDIYKQVIGEAGVTDVGLAAQEGLVCLYVKCGKQEEANAAYDQMLADFAAHEGLAKAVDHVADAYREKREYGDALERYQYAVDTWPQAEHAADAQRAVALTHFLLGDDTAADAAIDKLLNEFGQHAGIAKVVDHLADDLRELGEYERARDLYATVADRWADAPHAVNCAAGVVRTSILLGDDPNAQSGLDRLLADFGGHAGAAKALDNIADEYRNRGSYERARAVYKDIVEKWPASDYALESQKGFVVSSIALGDDPNAQAGAEKLLSDYGGKSELASVLYDVAKAYEKAKNYQGAKGIYEQIAAKLPSSKKLRGAQLHIAKIDVYSCVYAEDYNGVLAGVDNLIVDFNGHPELAGAVFEIGARYYECGLRYEPYPTAEEEARYADCKRKAITIWEKIIEDLAECKHTGWAYYWSAVCYVDLKDCERALSYYQIVAAEWPDYGRSQKVNFAIGRCYRRLKKQRKLPKKQADALTAAAYRRLIVNHPNSGAARVAREWLEVTFGEDSENGGTKK